MSEKKNVHQRLAAVMGEVSYIRREEKKGMSYKIVSHDKVTALVRPALLKHGIVYYPIRCDHQHNGNRAECSMTVRFVNVDEPADFIDVPSFGYGIDPQDKGPGKAMSYAVKYALLKALGLETGDDPDLESVDHNPVDVSGGAAEDAKAKLMACGRLDHLAAVWKGLSHELRAMPEVEAAKDVRKSQLTEKEAA